MRRCIALLSAVLLTACATTASPPAANTSLFDDSRFAPASERIDAQDIFALTPEMKAFVRDKVVQEAKIHGSTKALYYALYPNGALRIDYDSSITRNARQTFEAKSGNCLSLAIMTAALAREFDLTVQYQHVLVDESWSRRGDLFFSSGHVNLILGRQHKVYLSMSAPTDAVVIDFLPSADAAHLPTRMIDEKMIVAMFMNNRAAESLANGRINDAYWWAREAILQDASFTATYNTLGVIYLRHHDPHLAQRALSYSLELDPRNTTAMYNLVQAYADQGLAAEAQKWNVRLHQLEPDQPYHFFNLGRTAMDKGDYRAARDLFQKEVQRDPYNHEFQFWLAAACFRLGDLKSTNEHLKLAMQYSTTRDGRELYAAKLDRLKAYLAN
jgi:Flp pilus assembly protein TadD